MCDYATTLNHGGRTIVSYNILLTSFNPGPLPAVSGPSTSTTKKKERFDFFGDEDKGNRVDSVSRQSAYRSPHHLTQ